MKCAVWYGKDDIRIEECPISKPNPGQVLVKVVYSGICGTDQHILAGEMPLSMHRPPKVIGHEFTGEIAEIGADVSGLQKGMRVVAHPRGYCGECYFCRNAHENFCTHQAPWQGAFAEYVLVKSKQVYVLPDEISFEEAAIVEPLAITVHVADRAEISSGQTVCIIGAGTIGLLMLQVAYYAGAAKVIISDPVEERLKLAQKLGADITVNPLKEDLPSVLREATGNLGVDSYIETAGLPFTIKQGISVLRNAGGILVIVGAPSASANIEINPFEFYSREITVKGSFFSPYCFDRAIALLKRVDVKSLITHKIPLINIREGFAALKRKEAIKVLLEL
jgi:L-iditol 2-dehydrogenase